MYENDYMYAIERNDEYLAHYGVRGMKWGVRKAIASGNERRLSRQYAKAQKKLAKLDKQAGRTKKYARRAALMGAGAAAAGGLAALGTEGVRAGMGAGGKLMTRAGSGLADFGERIGRGTRNKVARRIGNTLHSAGRGIDSAGRVVGGAKVGNAISNWGKSTTLSGAAQDAIERVARGSRNKLVRSAGSKMHTSLNRVSNNTIARVGAGVVGAGLAAGAARNAYKAATAQKRAAQFRSEMNKAFAGTKYANGAPRQGKKRRR